MSNKRSRQVKARNVAQYKESKKEAMEKADAMARAIMKGETVPLSEMNLFPTTEAKDVGHNMETIVNEVTLDCMFNDVKMGWAVGYSRGLNKVVSGAVILGDDTTVMLPDDRYGSKEIKLSAGRTVLTAGVGDARVSYDCWFTSQRHLVSTIQIGMDRKKRMKKTINMRGPTKRYMIDAATLGFYWEESHQGSHDGSPNAQMYWWNFMTMFEETHTKLMKRNNIPADQQQFDVSETFDGSAYKRQQMYKAVQKAKTALRKQFPGGIPKDNDSGLDSSSATAPDMGDATADEPMTEEEVADTHMSGDHEAELAEAGVVDPVLSKFLSKVESEDTERKIKQCESMMGGWTQDVTKVDAYRMDSVEVGGGTLLDCFISALTVTDIPAAATFVQWITENTQTLTGMDIVAIWTHFRQTMPKDYWDLHSVPKSSTWE